MSWFKILKGYFFFSILCFVAWLAVVEMKHEEPLPESVEVSSEEEVVPNFTEINPMSEKKRAFFAYLQPIIEEENQNITALREQLIELQNKPEISGKEYEFIKQLRIEYQIKPSSDWKKTVSKLLDRVNTVPSSLVLAQAAIESAWGTSRFAKEGYNLFGQWCFKRGCGMVPQERQVGLKHEVRVFQSIHDSVHHYMLNINSHPAYKKLRALRDQQLAQANKPAADVSGCLLAEGLENYSQKGLHYVNSIKQLIRVNKLEPKSSFCKKIIIAEVPDLKELPATGAVMNVPTEKTQADSNQDQQNLKKTSPQSKSSNSKEQQASVEPISSQTVPNANDES